MYVFESYPPDHSMGARGDKFGRIFRFDQDGGCDGNKKANICGGGIGVGRP